MHCPPTGVQMGSTLCYWSMVPRQSGLEAVSHVTVNHYVNTTVVVFYWTSAIVFCQISGRSRIQRYFHLRRTANMLCFKWEAFSHMMDRTDVRREFPLWLKRAMGSFDGRNSWANRVTVSALLYLKCWKASCFNEMSAYCWLQFSSTSGSMTWCFLI